MDERQVVQFWRAVLPHYVCGFFVKNGVITEAADIMGWARGKSFTTFFNWVTRRGGNLELLSTEET